MIKTTNEMFLEDMAKISSVPFKAPASMLESRQGAIKTPIMESKESFKKMIEAKKSKKDEAKSKLKSTKDKLMEVYSEFVLEGASLQIANDDPENADKVKAFEAALCEAIDKAKSFS
jgi:hypothetical protein